MLITIYLYFERIHCHCQNHCKHFLIIVNFGTHILTKLSFKCVFKVCNDYILIPLWAFWLFSVPLAILVCKSNLYREYCILSRNWFKCHRKHFKNLLHSSFPKKITWHWIHDLRFLFLILLNLTHVLNNKKCSLRPPLPNGESRMPQTICPSSPLVRIPQGILDYSIVDQARLLNVVVLLR
jgi:hypothetical protein